MSDNNCGCKADGPMPEVTFSTFIISLASSALVHLGEVVAVAVPSYEQEAARDVVRAREDCRADLMASRLRLYSQSGDQSAW